MDTEIYNKITKRKQFSQLCKIDVEMAWKHFENRQTSTEDKIKLTRNLLGKSFAMFTSKRFLKSKFFEAEWILKRHSSTSERFEFYPEIYSKIFLRIKEKAIVFDLGAGVNGFSYSYFPKGFSYVGIESLGQLVKSMNLYFEKKKFKNAKAMHFSLFELQKIKKLIKKEKGKKIIFLFKVLDSLEMLEKGYSKIFLEEIVNLADKVAISFATRSLIKKTKFKVNRKWLFNLISLKFKLIDQFEIGNEKYIIFSKK